MTQDDWVTVVTREMKADLWYAEPEDDEMVIETHSPGMTVLSASRNGNSPKVNAVAGHDTV